MQQKNRKIVNKISIKVRNVKTVIEKFIGSQLKVIVYKTFKVKIINKKYRIVKVNWWAKKNK